MMRTIMMMMGARTSLQHKKSSYAITMRLCTDRSERCANRSTSGIYRHTASSSSLLLFRRNGKYLHHEYTWRSTDAFVLSYSRQRLEMRVKILCWIHILCFVYMMGWLPRYISAQKNYIINREYNYNYIIDKQMNLYG